MAKAPWFASAARQQRLLVAVSGGADSVALLRLLVADGFTDLIVCHLDHQLRGEESAADVVFVQQLALQLGQTYAGGVAAVNARMVVRGESLETAARHARHQFYAECAVKYDCQRVLLAHHADDQAETVLWNLLRGSHGLKGMRETHRFISECGTPLELIRPLLGVSRSELRAWLAAQRFSWREDASNLEPIAVRNRLRNEALPLLAEISGRDAVAAFARGAADSAENEALEAWLLEQAAVRDPQGRLHTAVLKKLPLAVQRIAVRRFLIEHGLTMPDRGTLERVLSLLDVNQAAVLDLPSGFKFRRREGRMWIERQKDC